MKRIHVPIRIHHRIWCETTRVVHTALCVEVDRSEGATHAVASRALADAALIAASRSALYERFRRGYVALVLDSRGGFHGRFKAADFWD